MGGAAATRRDLVVLTCLVLGGASCLHDDIAAYAGPVDGVVTVNDAVTEWRGDVDAAVSLHPQFFEQKGWLAARNEKGLSAPRRVIGHEEGKRVIGMRGVNVPGLEFTPYRFPGQEKSGSSGLFAAKVALIDLGFDQVVFCGVPMTATPHFWDDRKEPWKSADGFRGGWLAAPEEYRSRMASMSGWSRILLGGPQ